MKKRLKFFVFLLIAVFLPFVIANEIIRWVWYKNYPLKRLSRRDWDLVYSLTPNFHARLPVGINAPRVWKGTNAQWEISINSQGIRHPGEIPPKSPSIVRILCLGDSVTFGLDVDDQYTYPSQLAEILNDRVGGQAPIETINGGVFGYSSRQGLIFLSERLLKYQPDLVILGFGLDDAPPNMGIPDRLVMAGEVKKGWRKIYKSPLEYPLLLLAQPLPTFLWYQFYIRVLVQTEKFAFVKNLQRSQGGQSNERVNMAEDSKRFKHSRVPPADFLDNLNQFIYLAQQNRFRLIFYLPYELAPVYRQVILNLAQEHGIPVVDFSEKLNHYEISELMKNPACARLLPYYQEKLGKDFLEKFPLFAVTTDLGHPNAVGNRIIAEEMARAVLSLYPSH